MNHRVINKSCPGHEKFKTIQIDYHINGGRKEDGTHFSGAYRTAYLPNSKEGKDILRMLEVAFERKLTFTVGTSVTTGV